MGIFDRVGTLIKSYLNDEDTRVFKRSSQDPPYDDPDIQAAFEELNDFLGGKKKSPPGNGNGYAQTEYRRTEYTKGGATYSRTEYSRTEWTKKTGKSRNGSGGKPGDGPDRNPAPEALRGDFAELEVPFGAKAEVCKAAYKRLLKVHHPDRHAGHSGNMLKATEKSVRINAAYDRIERWRRTGTVS